MNKLYCYSSTKRAMQRTSMAAIAMAVAFPVQAQEAQSDGLAEIIVTAEKREENLQSVPVSVTAMTGEALTATGISNVEDLQFFVPGVSITNDSMAIINIRGIGTSAFGVATDPSTTVHYDGVYISRPTTSYQDLFDVERIEVLRGPQGVLFGRNSAGGTLNIISKMPTEDLTGALGLTVGNYEKRSLSGTISGPLGAGVRGRLTLLANQRDGIYRDIVSGRRYQNEDNLAGRLTLAIDASDRLEIVLRADASRDRETGARSVRPFYPQGFVDAGATIPANDKEAALDRLPRYDVDAWGVSSTMNWDGGPVTLRSITALRKSKVVQALDVDSTDLFLRDIEFYERSRSFTQEFQLLNNDADKLRWIVGAFYLNEKGNDEIRIIEPGRRLAIPENNTTNAFALFGQASYELIDRLRLTGGLRYSYEKKDFGYRVLLNGNQVDAGQPKSSWTAWTPKIGIDYDLADDVMAYASATRGFKSGGFQLGDGRPFLPEYVWSYEVGLKSTLLDRRLRANFSAFYYDYTNLQVVEYNNGVASTTNAGKATIKGVEAELMARPFDRLTLTSTIAYLDARYDVYFDDVGASLKGKRLPNAPKWNITLGGEYKASLGGGMLTLRTDISWRDSIFFKPSNNPLFSGNATTLINGRVAWQPASEAWEIALYGRNLTNERYVSYSTIGTDATGVSNPTLPLYIYGEPRQYGLQLRYFF